MFILPWADKVLLRRHQMVLISCGILQFLNMHIGFDAKRIFQNSTGLGNYSRSLVSALAGIYPENKYTLFAPKQTSLFDINHFNNITIKLPVNFANQKLPGLWRRVRMVKDIAGAEVDIFHGLSNELPLGISKSGVKSVVTVHDLIFERYPETYHWDERYTHRWKMQSSCREADAIIAASEQTKQDLIDFYKIPPEKIFVCYQHCSPIFEQEQTAAQKHFVKSKYNLPDKFFLFTGSVTKRKNLITVCKALVLLKNQCNIPVAVIGNGKKEKQLVQAFLRDNHLQNAVIFLNDLESASTEGFRLSNDFPAIYQQALALIYPSFFEGFGIPILEAMWSSLPVITADTSSLPEVAGNAALYFKPGDVKALAEAMNKVATDELLRMDLQQKGLIQATRFTAAKHAEDVMAVYKAVL